jgi:hypothetical protein
VARLAFPVRRIAGAEPAPVAPGEATS